MAVKKSHEYTKEFKQEAVKLVLDLGSVSVEAKKLGMAASVLFMWRSKLAKDGSDAFPGKLTLQRIRSRNRFY